MSHLADNRRHSLITASRAWAAVYERQKYWREMTLRKPPFEGNEMTQWGNDHERVALSQFERDMGEICEVGNNFIVHSTLPFGASPDAYLDGLPVEIKCPFSQVIYPQIPERYFFQVQLQIEVLDVDAAWFYVWTPEAASVQRIERDPVWFAWYLPLALEFLEYVKTDTEPKRWNRKPIFNKETA